MQTGATVDQDDIRSFLGLHGLDQTPHAMGKALGARWGRHIGVGARQLGKIGRFAVSDGACDTNASRRVFCQWAIGNQVIKKAVGLPDCIFDEPIDKEPRPQKNTTAIKLEYTQEEYDYIQDVITRHRITQERIFYDAIKNL